ncbi:MAG: F0F1 ATP synthase subunit gamma [Chloroflexota bacterium]
MTQTLESLRSRIQSTEALQSVVKTMKAMAAVNIRQYEKAVESLGDYSRTLEMGLQVVLGSEETQIAETSPVPDTGLGAIVFGSDQGMVGQFNQRIALYAVNRIDELQVPPKGRRVIAVGLRVAARLDQAGQPVETSLPVPGSVAGITPMVEEIVLRIEKWRWQQGVERVLLFHSVFDSGASYHQHTQQLLPLDLEWLRGLAKREWHSRSLPTFTMQAARLLAALVREYFFISLYRAFAESLASENASRLSSVQSAEKNIEERLDVLHAQFQNVRQTSITEELLDVVAGFEALQVKEGQ